MVRIICNFILLLVVQLLNGQSYVPDWKVFDTIIYSKPIALIDFESSSFTESSIYKLDSVECYENNFNTKTRDNIYEASVKFFNNIESHIDDSLKLEPLVLFSYEHNSNKHHMHFVTGKTKFDDENETSNIFRANYFQDNNNSLIEVEGQIDLEDICSEAFIFSKPIDINSSIDKFYALEFQRIDSFLMGMYSHLFKPEHMIELGSQQIIFNEPVKNFAGLPNYEGCPKNESFGVYNYKKRISFSFGKPEKPFKLHPFITQKDALKYRGSSPEEALRLYQFGYGDVLVNTVCDDFDVSEENRTYNLDLKDETHLDVKKVLKFKCDGVNFIAFNYDLHYSYYNTKNNFVRKNNTQVLRYDFEDKTWKVTKSYNYTMDHIIHILSRLKYDVLFKFVGVFSKGPDSSWTQLEKDVYEFCGKRNFYVQRLIILINYWRETEQQDKLDALFGKDMMIQDLLFEILFSPKEYQENNDYSGGWDE